MKSFSYINEFLMILIFFSNTVSDKFNNVTLYNILHLCIRVWSFNFIRNKAEKHNQKNNNSRPKALRKETKRLQHFSNDAFQSYYDIFQVNWLVKNQWYLYKS